MSEFVDRSAGSYSPNQATDVNCTVALMRQSKRISVVTALDDYPN